MKEFWDRRKVRSLVLNRLEIQVEFERERA